MSNHSYNNEPELGPCIVAGLLLAIPFIVIYVLFWSGWFG